MKSLTNNFSRRHFFKRAAVLAPAIALPRWLHAAPEILAGHSKADGRSQSTSVDLVILGGGLGGCAAALAAARNGLKIAVTEETDWIGGQITQQGVPPDENKWIESFGASASYQKLRQGIRDYYKQNYPLTAAASAKKNLNPGNSWVSLIGGEPRVALAVLYEMLAPYIANGQIQILLNHQAKAAEVSGNRVVGIQVLDTREGREIFLEAPYFIDATEQGDLLPLTNTEYLIGAESKAETGEPHAKEHSQPDNLQGITCCFAMDYLHGEDHIISRPKNYNHWRDLKITTGKHTRPLFTFETDDVKKIGFDPIVRNGFWTYRRVADRDLFRPGFYRSDVTIVNWAQNDYSFGRICDVSKAVASQNLKEAKEQSLSLLYWLQTEAPRPDGGTGWKGLRLRPDVLGTSDGLAKYPYIREGRRIQAEFTVLEQHVTTDMRMKETGEAKDTVRAMPFRDSVGIGSYHMDIHRTTTGDSGAYGSTLPFQIPLGALIPKRMENLLPGCKNAGVTHLTNGCYRLHPVEWGIGEAAGALAAFCVAQKKSPREVRNTRAPLADFQKLLLDDGVRIEWPREASAI